MKYQHMNQNQGTPMMQQNGMNMQQPMGNPYMQMQNNTMQGNPMMQGGMNPQAVQNNPYFQAQMNPYTNPTYAQNSSSGWISLLGETPSDKFLRGLLIGGAAAYILTNESVQKAIIKTGLKVYSTLAGGVEEFKEKIMDVKAEIEAEQAAETE
jgi:hypothetical protein